MDFFSHSNVDESLMSIRDSAILAALTLSSVAEKMHHVISALPMLTFALPWF